MGKVRCPGCDRRVDENFDYCPSCGCRMPHDAEEARRDKGGGRRGCIILFFIMVTACAVAVTVYLVREHDREEASRALAKERRDSIKALEVAVARREAHRADSLQQVRDSIAEVARLRACFFTLDDFVGRDGDGRLGMRRVDDIARKLRERGYHTLRRQTGDSGGLVMGLNADIADAGNVSPRGAVFSVAGIWPGRIEVTFSSVDEVDDFMLSAGSLGFRREDERCYRCAGLDITVRSERLLVITAR